MVRLPLEFVAIKYRGYFWSLDEKRLYSIKPSGVLRPLKMVQPNRWNHFSEPLYAVSVNGKTKYIGHKYLMPLEARDSSIPVERNP